MTYNAAFWNNLAEDYAAKPVDNIPAFERKIEITLANITSDDVVLGIGCGTGSLALRLASAAKEVHGLDLSSEMIRIARGKAEKAGADNVHFHVGPFDNSFTQFEDGSLDGICAYSILHLIEHRQAALDQIYRLLKPGGFFISSTVCIGDSFLRFTGLLPLMRLVGKAPLVKTFPQQQLLQEFKDTGFVDISTPDVGAKKMIAFVVARKPAQ